MKRKPYKVLIVDDEEIIRNSLSEIVKYTGNIPISFPSGMEAIKYLKDKNHITKAPHHRDIALILSDYQMNPCNGLDVLKAKLLLDRDIPFFLLSGNIQDPNVTYEAAKYQASGYLKKPINLVELEELINNVLIEKIDLDCPTIAFKIGGSAGDHFFETEDSNLALVEFLNFCVQIQKQTPYQVILAPGASKRGDLLKTLLRKCNKPSIKFSHSRKVLRDLQSNMEDIVDMMEDDSEINKNAFWVNPTQLITNYKDVKGFLNRNKVMVMAYAPRHLSLEYKEITNPNNLHYPNIPPEDSDSQFLLLCELFNIKTSGILKRVDRPYLFDPNKGLETNEWQQIQSQNKPLEKVSFEEIKNGKTYDGTKLSFIGDDGEPGHLWETSAAKLGMISDIVEKICIIHLAPNELYLNGKHIVTGEMWPQDKTQNQYVQERIAQIITQSTSPFLYKKQ